MKKSLLFLALAFIGFPAFSQTLTSLGHGTVSQTSPLTSSVSVTAGHQILVIGAVYSVSTGNSLVFSDSQANAVTVLKTYNNGSSTNYALIVAATFTATSTGSDTISCTFSGYDCRFWVADISSYGGLDQQGAYDNAGGGGGAGPTTVTASSGNTANSDIVISAVQLASYDASSTLGHPATTGYTDGYYDNGSADFSNAQFDVSYKTSGSAGTTDTASWTYTGSFFSTAILLTIKGSGGAVSHGVLTSGGHPVVSGTHPVYN